MKKGLFTILLISTLTTTSWADISTKQLNTYMKVSGADVEIESIQKKIASIIKINAKRRGKEVSTDVLKAIRTIISNKENLKQLTKGLKGLDQKSYQEIIQYYDTKIGRKEANLARDKNSLTRQQTKFSKKNLSKKRQSLLTQLTDITISEKRRVQITKILIEAKFSTISKEKRVLLKDKIDAKISKMKPILKEQAEEDTAYDYRDYSDSELKLLIDHYKMSSAQKEIDAIIDGLTGYMKVVMSQIMEVIKKKNNDSQKSYIFYK